MFIERSDGIDYLEISIRSPLSAQWERKAGCQYYQSMTERKLGRGIFCLRELKLGCVTVSRVTVQESRCT